MARPTVNKLILKHCVSLALVLLANPLFGSAQLHTYNGDDSIDEIEVQVVYYLIQGEQPLPDWRERVDYHMRRVQSFHHRELARQSTMHYSIHPAPFVSSEPRDGFPRDDANAFFWHIINEVWKSGEIEWSEGRFPILLVMADCNFSPGYDDWTRECLGEGCFLPEPHSDCAGHVRGDGEDRPGSRAGGARAVYWPEQHIGLGLVTADGWRAPIKGTDCVVYHEGIGHAIGLPHPDPMNNSIMGGAQYVDSIQTTWIDDDQKAALGWQPVEIARDDLFSTFSVSHSPARPAVDQPVRLQASLPEGFNPVSVVAEVQYGLRQPFTRLPAPYESTRDGEIVYVWTLPPLAQGASLAYRIRVELANGESEEIWHYLKAR